MASRVLLINSNRCEEPYPVFPLGLGHLAAALQQAGHQTRWFDAAATAEPLAKVAAEFAPDVVGVSCRNIDDIQFSRRRTYFEDAAGMVRAVRETTRCPVIVGGSAFALYPEQILALTGADYGVYGGAEAAVVRLIAALENGADGAAIPNLVYRRDGHIVLNPPETIEPGDLLPAARPPELVNYYLRRSTILNVQTQRGCPLRCVYCTYPLIEGRASRQRSPDAVAAEMKSLQQQGAKYVFIVDSVFNTSAEHVAAVCEAIFRHDVRLQWSCFLRPVDLSVELMKLLARAGLTHIEFGSDSFCDPVLHEYGKSFTFDDILRTNERARAAGIHQSHFLICGGPGETPDTLQTTFENSRRLRSAVIFGLAGMRIYPGTPLADRAQREGRITPATDLLPPVYYLSAAFTEETLLQQLAEFRRQASHWIIGEFPPAIQQLTTRLRQRGVIGPLWEYYEPLQRLR